MNKWQATIQYSAKRDKHIASTDWEWFCLALSKLDPPPQSVVIEWVNGEEKS